MSGIVGAVGATDAVDMPDTPGAVGVKHVRRGACGTAVTTGESLIIRPLRRADYHAVTELIRQAWYADGDVAGNAVRGGSTAMSRRRSTHGLSISQRLAAIDAEECLSRTTHAAAAEYEGRVVGVILGSEQGRTTPVQHLRHRMRQIRLGLPLLGSAAGVRGLCGQLALAHIDGKLLRDAGLGKRDGRAERGERAEHGKRTERGERAGRPEIALFVVSPETRGQGVGRRLFNHMLDHFRAIGADGYFLFTDSSCDVGFYEHNGLKRAASRTLTAGDGTTAGTLECFLYEGNIPENR